MTAESALPVLAIPDLASANGQCSEPFKPCLRHFASTPGRRPTGSGGQKGSNFIRLDDEQTVRLAPVRGYLGQELIGRNAGRKLSDATPDGSAPELRCATRVAVGRPVLFSVTSEIGFVQR